MSCVAKSASSDAPEVRRHGDRARHVELDLHVAIVLLDSRDRIAAERETCLRLACRCKLHDHLREPLWIAGLLMIHGRGETTHLSYGVCIVVDSHGGAAQ